MRLHLLHDSLIESVHVELVEDDSCDYRFTGEIELDILLQVIQRMLISFHQHEVETLLGQIVSVYTACFSASAVDDSGVGGTAGRLRIQIFCGVAHRLKVSHDVPAEFE